MLKSFLYLKGVLCSFPPLNRRGLLLNDRIIRYYSTFYPKRPKRDLYEYEDEQQEREREQDHGRYNGKEWEYHRSWKDWCYDHQKSLFRAGILAIGAGGYYWYHLEPAPITGRKRFMSLSERQESVLAEMSLKQIIQEYKGSFLPPNHPTVRFIEKVAKRIIDGIEPATLVESKSQWRVFVIDSPVANAFVLPGGEIFVFTGLLPIAESEDGLATIIGHEIAHKLARHSAEKLSFYQFFTIASMAFQIFLGGGDLGHFPFSDLLQQLFLFLPFSRKCEVEADYIGLLLMSRACYDPSQAIGLWQRMQQNATKGQGRGGGGKVPAFMSTHPSNDKRIEKLHEWMPRAIKEFENSGCVQKKAFFKYSIY